MWPFLFLLVVSASLVSAQGSWPDALDKAKAALTSLSPEEKVGMVTGSGWQKGPCVGNTGAADSIGFPALCAQDGPLGVRYAKGVTAFPAGIHAASTWDRDLLSQRGAALGEEAKAKGVNVQLGPASGPLGKIPQGGRGWEGFSPDPYLAGIAMRETIIAMQSAGTQACAKHYIANEQEHNRETMSSNPDDRTLHELYLWPFADAVQAGVTSVMCSYNKVGSNWACEDPHLLTDVLKGELGFQGYVMSDWGAQHTTEGSANAGMDMSMPGDNFGDGVYIWGDSLSYAVDNGQVEQARVDDMVTRILAGWYYTGQDAGFPAVGFDSWTGGDGDDVQGDHATVARAIARDGIVLLQNINDALPLSKPASLAIIGADAEIGPSGLNGCKDNGCNDGTLVMGWGSGTVDLPYLVSPLDAIKAQADADGTTLATSTTDDIAGAASAAAAAETAIVFINSDSGEEYIEVEGNVGDRNDLDPWHGGNDLVAAVAEANKNTIVVVHSVGPIILESILAQENVRAVVWAGLPGQESGNGLVDVLYGGTSPNGKLPYTIAKDPADYGTSIINGDDSFSEGLYIDYRHFDSAGIEPRYEFGFGLSYTTFDYADLAVDCTATSGPASGDVAPGGPADLFDPVGTITASITNNGTVTGAEVAQLYLTLPGSAPESPPRQLRGFAKLQLEAGASDTATFELRRRDLSYWDGTDWVVPAGDFAVMVGASSRQVRLEGTLTVA